MLAPEPTLTDNQDLVIIESWRRDEEIERRHVAVNLQRSNAMVSS